jgi:hypothetical protein
MEKPTVRLENWTVLDSSLNYGDLGPGNRLAGNAFGHADVDPGGFIYTSPILRVNEQLIETRNTVYELGESSDVYKTWKRKQNLERVAA